MDEQRKNPRPVNPRRRKRSKLQTFKEAYLPVVIAAAAVLLIVIFIVGSVSRANEQKRLEQEASIESSIQQASEAARLEQEVQTLLAQAARLIPDYDYAGAIAILESFSGDMMDYPQLTQQIIALRNRLSNLADAAALEQGTARHQWTQLVLESPYPEPAPPPIWDGGKLY